MFAESLEMLRVISMLMTFNIPNPESQICYNLQPFLQVYFKVKLSEQLMAASYRTQMSTRHGRQNTMSDYI